MNKVTRYRGRLFITAILGSFISMLIGIYIGKSVGIPFTESNDTWSIGILTGTSPSSFTSSDNMKQSFTNPVLTAKHVSDVSASFVADPFMIDKDNTWYMFFEVLNTETKQGDIGMATSEDGLHWAYRQIVLDEPFHLSYPSVFKWENTYYMIPESRRSNTIRLYKAIEFPTKWTLVSTLLSGEYSDPSIFRFNGKWWMYACTTCLRFPRLWLYYADELEGPWIEHPKSPLIEDDARSARPGGRVVVFDDRIIRYAQDGVPYYGRQVRAFEVTDLTTTSYQEREVDASPILQPNGSGWNSKGMHHIDPHRINNDRWIAVVDGNEEVFAFRFKP